MAMLRKSVKHSPNNGSEDAYRTLARFLFSLLIRGVPHPTDVGCGTPFLGRSDIKNSPTGWGRVFVTLKRLRESGVNVARTHVFGQAVEQRGNGAGFEHGTDAGSQ